jgi:hypothetical protein
MTASARDSALWRGARAARLAKAYRVARGLLDEPFPGLKPHELHAPLLVSPTWLGLPRPREGGGEEEASVEDEEAAAAEDLDHASLRGLIVLSVGRATCLNGFKLLYRRTEEAVPIVALCAATGRTVRDGARH